MVIVSSVILWKKFKDTDLKAKWDNFVAEMGSGPGYPLEMTGGEVLAMSEISQNPVVLTQSHLYIYNSKAKTVVSEQHGFNKPFLVKTREQLLLGDRGGKKVNLITTSGTSYEHKLENSLIDAHLSQSGIFGVVTESQNFQGELSVFTKNALQGYTQIFKWSSAENIITDLAISDDGKTLVAAAVNSVDGILTSYLYLFNLADGAEVYREEFKGEFALETAFKDNKAVFISDKSIRSIDVSGDNLKEYSFMDYPLYGYSLGENGNIALVLGDFRHNHSLDIISLDTQMWQQGKMAINYEPSYIFADQKGICIIGADKIMLYNQWLTKSQEYNKDMVKKGQIIGSKLYYTTPEYLNVEEIRRPDNKKPQ